MSSILRTAPLALLLAALCGCASTQVTSREAYEGPRLPRPDRILVYDFAASSEDLPPWATTAERYQVVATASPKELDVARKLGVEIAKELVEKIREMGLNALPYDAAAPAGEGDLVIVGYFESVDSGSVEKRVALGFGSGGAELRTRVEGYRMHDGSLELLGGGTVDAGDSKGPGLIVPLAVAAATANPAGLIVGGAIQAEGEMSGRTTIEGSAKRTAKEIATQLQPVFERQGWI